MGDWFKTGDMCYRDEDGWFHLCGRKKDMKSMLTNKKRDLKMSFLYVEEELLEHPRVHDCAVVNAVKKSRRKTSGHMENNNDADDGGNKKEDKKGKADDSSKVYTAFVVVECENESDKEKLRKEL